MQEARQWELTAVFLCGLLEGEFPRRVTADPILGDDVRFKLKQGDYPKMGERIAWADLPTLFVMEGGYAVEMLGVNTVNVLLGFEQR